MALKEVPRTQPAGDALKDLKEIKEKALPSYAPKSNPPQEDAPSVAEAKENTGPSFELPKEDMISVKDLNP